MTLSGRLVNRDNQVVPTLADMSVGLSRMPRFAGQTTVHPWSVAHHLLAGATYAERWVTNPHTPLDFLLHDAHEAMTADTPTSFKTEDQRALQAELDTRIYCALAISLPDAPRRALIKQIDVEMLVAEARAVTPFPTYERILHETGFTTVPILALDAVRIVLKRGLDADAAAEAWYLTTLAKLKREELFSR